MSDRRKAAVAAVALFFVSLWVVMGAGVTAIWLTGQAKVFGLIVLPATIVAVLLIQYFDWRARLFDEHSPAEAAHDTMEPARRIS